ncbi:MAG TPA: DUF6325 family protein [Glaciihabitans sp.]|nr:DUF6325 family protein [Glaciihabitans sp.]
MTDFEHGPVELYVIGFSTERPGTGVVDAIADLVQSETVMLLDLVFARRSQDGELTIIELDELTAEYGLPELNSDELGLIGEEDINELTDTIEPGASAALLIVEHAWAREFAEAVFRADGRVVDTLRIPAADINAMIDATAA